MISGKLRSGSTASWHYLQAMQDEINTSSQAAAIAELMFPNVRFSGSNSKQQWSRGAADNVLRMRTWHCKNRCGLKNYSTPVEFAQTIAETGRKMMFCQSVSPPAVAA